MHEKEDSFKLDRNFIRTFDFKKENIKDNYLKKDLFRDIYPDKDSKSDVIGVNRQLEARNAYLEQEVSRLQTSLDASQGQVTRQTRTIEGLQDAIIDFGEQLDYWKAEAEKGRQTNVNVQDPRGYCKALGADSDVLKSLSQEDAEKYLTRLRNAQAFVSHTDFSSGDHDRMKAVNEAYEFLKDPRKRSSYTR